MWQPYTIQVKEILQDRQICNAIRRFATALHMGERFHQGQGQLPIANAQIGALQ